jgi:hypothetical protein
MVVRTRTREEEGIFPDSIKTKETKKCPNLKQRSKQTTKKTINAVVFELQVLVVFLL